MIHLDSIDLMDVFDFLEEVENNSVDLAIIDPPYNLSQGVWDTFKSQEDFLSFTKKYLDIVISKLKDNGSLYIFNTAFNSAYILIHLVNRGLEYKNWIVWYKKDGFSACKKKYVNSQETILYFTKSNKEFTFNFDDIREPYLSSDRISAARKKGIIKNGKRWFPNPNGKLCPDVWEFTSVRHTNKYRGKVIKQGHPTPKPEPMIERMIKASSNEGDLIMDLFSGTGTTAFVAKKLKRHFIGCENNEQYYAIIKERLK